MSTDADTITDEVVAAIADRMIEEGKRVSPVAIWSEVRGGSLVAIVAALERWREAREDKTLELQLQAGLPGSLAETVMSAAARIWTTSQETAEKAFNQRLTVTGQHLETAFAERDEALTEYQKIVEEVEAGRERIIALTSALSASENAALHLGAELATATGRTEAAETRVDELVQRVSIDKANLEATKASLDEQRKAHEELVSVVSSKSDEIARITHERDDARQEVAMLGETCQAKSEEVQKWSQESSAATLRAQSAEARIEELVQRASVEQANLDATKASLDEERKAREGLAALVSSKRDEIARITQDRDGARQEVATLSDTCQAKSDEVNRLSAESSALKSRAQTAEARIEELVQRASVEGGNLATTKASLEEERKALEELTAVVSSKNDEIARISQEYETARQEVATLSAACQAKSDEADRLSDDLSAASSRMDAAGAQANESLARFAALAAELDEARAALAAERETAATQIDRASAQIEELQRITLELEETRKQVGALAEAKTATSAELDRLSQDAVAARDRADTAERHAAQLEQRLTEQADAVAKDSQRNLQLGVRADQAANEVAALQRQISAQAQAHAKALSDLRVNAEQWVAHATELKQRLGQAGEKILFIDARSTGEVVLVRRLSSELERLKPDHELISRDAQQKLIGATMAQQLAQKGYRYDPSTAVMSKVDG